MLVKLIILGTTVTIFGAFSALVLKVVTSQSVDNSPLPSIETIDGIGFQQSQAFFG